MEGGSAPNKGAATGGWSVPGLDEASQSILADVAERTAREEEFLGTKKKAADARILRQEGGLSDDIDFGSVPQVRRRRREACTQREIGDDAPGVDVGRRASERGGLRRAAAQEDDNHIMPTRMLLRPNAESTFFRRGSDCRRRLPPYPSKGGVERVHAVASRGGTRGGGGWEVLMAERGGSAAAGGDRQRRGRGRLWRPSWRRATGRWTTCSRTCRALRLRRRGEAPCIPSSASRTVLRPRRQRCGSRPRRRFSAQERICVGWVKGIGQVF